MSRPFFALSVMLSFLAFSLVAIEKTHAADDVVSPSHGPSECILCPLAHGDSYQCAEAPCGDYSDYDYNDYRVEGDPAPVPPPTEEAETTEVSSDDYYFSEYDWYGEDFASDSVGTAEAGAAREEATAAANEYQDFEYYSGYESYEDFTDGENSSADAIPVDAAEPMSVEAATADTVEEADGEIEWTGHERGSYSGYESYEAFMEAGIHGKVGCFAGYSSYEAFLAADVAAGARSDEDPANDTGETVSNGDKQGYYAGYYSYEAYMEAGGANRVGCYAGYSSYDAFMQVATAAVPAAIDDEDGDSDWAGEDYGYYEDYESYVEEYEFEAPAAVDSTEDVEPTADELLQTGYDHAYDNAMNPAANDEQASAEEVSTADSTTIYDEYEAFYDAYDELYNFEPKEDGDSAPAPRLGPVIAEFEAAETISLEEFAGRIIRSVMQDLELEAPREAGSRPIWDCEEGVSTEAKTGPSVVQSTVQGMERAAVALQHAADDLLRRIAAGSELQIGRADDDQVAR